MLDSVFTQPGLSQTQLSGLFPRMISRFFTLLIIIALIAPAVGYAQTRQEKITEIIRVAVTVDLPIFRKEVLPEYARTQAITQLIQLGKQAELGAEWKSGNSYWDRAETALRRDFEGILDQRTARDRQDEANFKEAVEELSDAQLDEVLGFYRSDLFRKSMRAADGTVTMVTQLLLVVKQETAPQAVPDFKNLERELDRYSLTANEKEQLEKVLQSPAFQLLNRGAWRDFLSSIRDPSLLIEPRATEETRRAIGQIVSQFRDAYHVPSPLPPAYEADFIAQPAKEKSYRDTANAAMRSDAQALARIRDAAEGGDPIAQVELGRMYQIGRGVAEDDKAAFEWTRRAAEQGFPRAQFNLGVHYEQGIGVGSNLTGAVENYRRAAERGFARAQLALGLMYRTGKGVPQDFQRSLEFIGAAAKQRLPGAELAMAEIYDVGASVGRDDAVANSWLNRALNQSYAPAAQYRAQREKRKAELTALIKASPASAKASGTAVDKPELNRRLLEAVKSINIAYVRELLDAGADIETRDARPNEGETPLHHAARTGNVELATVIVSKGANVNVSAPSGFTPLHVAAGLNRRAMADYLLGAGANPNAMDSRGTPLHAATVQGNAAMAALLLDNGANPNARDGNGNTPLHMIGSVGNYYPFHTEIIRRLADGGADLFAVRGKEPYLSTAVSEAIRRTEDAAITIIESRAKLITANPDATPLPVALAGNGYMRAMKLLEGKSVPLDATGKNGMTALHSAAFSGKLEMAKYLISRGLGIDSRDARGRTPLHWAADHGFVDIMRLLLDSGAALESRDNRGWTPLMVAIVSWREGNAARALIERSVDISARDNDGRSVLEVSFMSYASDEAAKFVLDRGASISATDGQGRTALHKVQTEKQAALLIRRGADVNIKDSRGMSPLFYAVKQDWNSEALTRVFLSAGADTNLVASDGSRVVHHAATRNSKVLEAILDLRAGDANDRDQNGLTPLHWAAESGHPGTIAVLLKRGARIDTQSALGDTPLHLAASAAKHADSVAALLKAGANPKLRNKAGDTPADIAEKSGNKAALKLLQATGIQ